MGTDNNRNDMTLKKKKWINTGHGLKNNGYDWEDPKLSLGYIKIGQVDIQRTFGTDASIQDIHQTMNDNLNIKSIRTITGPTTECDYPYTLDSDELETDTNRKD